MALSLKAPFGGRLANVRVAQRLGFQCKTNLVVYDSVSVHPTMPGLDIQLPVLWFTHLQFVEVRWGRF